MVITGLTRCPFRTPEHTARVLRILNESGMSESNNAHFMELISSKSSYSEPVEWLCPTEGVAIRVSFTNKGIVSEIMVNKNSDDCAFTDGDLLDTNQALSVILDHL